MANNFNRVVMVGALGGARGWLGKGYQRARGQKEGTEAQVELGPSWFAKRGAKGCSGLDPKFFQGRPCPSSSPSDIAPPPSPAFTNRQWNWDGLPSAPTPCAIALAPWAQGCHGLETLVSVFLFLQSIHFLLTENASKSYFRGYEIPS